MRCTHCGANIPDDQLICPVCGAEVQIVPDYNPLEDVLAREVKGSVAGATRQIQADVVRRQNVSQNQQNRNRQNQRSNPNSTRVLSQAELDKVREERAATASESAKTTSENRCKALSGCPSVNRESAPDIY